MTLEEACAVLGITDGDISKENVIKHYRIKVAQYPDPVGAAESNYMCYERALLEDARQVMIANNPYEYIHNFDLLKLDRPLTLEEQEELHQMERFYSEEGQRNIEAMLQKQVDNFAKMYEEKKAKEALEAQIEREERMREEAKKREQQEQLRREAARQRAEQERMEAERRAEEEKKKRTKNLIKKIFVVWFVFMVLYTLLNG